VKPPVDAERPLALSDDRSARLETIEARRFWRDMARLSLGLP
jgi:hypothetical protein